VIACFHRRTYETAGHRWRRTDTRPLQPSKALLTRDRCLRGPGSLSSSRSPRCRSRLIRRTGSSGELSYSGARHRQDSMWRGLLVTEPLVADSWSLLVAYSRPVPHLSFQGCAARGACRKPAAREIIDDTFHNVPRGAAPSPFTLRMGRLWVLELAGRQLRRDSSGRSPGLRRRGYQHRCSWAIGCQHCAIRCITSPPWGSRGART